MLQVEISRNQQHSATEAKASSKSAAPDSSSEKTEAADAEEEAPMTSQDTSWIFFLVVLRPFACVSGEILMICSVRFQDEASSPTKSSGSTPAKETVKPEAESHAKPSKTVETVAFLHANCHIRHETSLSCIPADVGELLHTFVEYSATWQLRSKLPLSQLHQLPLLRRRRQQMPRQSRKSKQRHRRRRQ